MCGVSSAVGRAKELIAWRPALERRARELEFTSAPTPEGRGQKAERSRRGEGNHPPRGGGGRERPEVHFTGFRSDLPAVYSELDVVVLCSRNEGLPVTLIEALAAGRPVVATEVGAVRDLVTPGETGLLVPSGDAEALTGAILRHLAHPEAAAEMGRRGREHVYPRFSVNRLERDVRGLYRELAGGLHL